MHSTNSQTMKAIRIHSFGTPEVLLYEDAPRPKPGPNEVLLRVAAAGVNPGDWKARSGYLRGYQLSFPFIPGWDVSGEIEEVGAGVSEWHKGEAVYGLTRFPSPLGGAYAEYAIARQTDLAPKPARLNHVEAAGVPMAALTAFQAIQKYGRLEKGQTVLVNGAAGGVGHFAVQLAKAKGARVIGVASGRHEAFLRDLGADEVVDYTTTPFSKVGRKADIVIDTLTNGNNRSLLEALKPGGALLAFSLSYSVEHEDGVTIQKTQVYSSGADLTQLNDLIDAGLLRVALDTVVLLGEASKAHERGEQGHLGGKIALRVRE